MCGVAYCCEWHNVGTTNGRRVREAREHWRRARRSDSGYVSDRFSASSSRRNGFAKLSARFLDDGKKLIKVGFPEDEANEVCDDEQAVAPRRRRSSSAESEMMNVC